MTFVAASQPPSHWVGAAAQVLAVIFCVALAGLVIRRRPLQGVSWLFAGLNLSLAYTMYSGLTSRCPRTPGPSP